MNKTTTAELSTDVQATLEAQVAQAVAAVTPAAPEVAVVARPALVELNGYSHVVMGAVAHLSRLGYQPFPGIAPTFHANTGLATVAMVLGSPDAYAVKLAEDAIANAVAFQEREYQKEVAQAAAKLVEASAAAAKQAALAKEVADARKALRALEAQLA